MKNRNQKIGPHAGSEIEMVLNGAKRFAVIEKRKNIASYFAAAAITRTGITIEYRESLDGPEVIITSERELIAEYDALLENGVSRFGIENYHRKLGALFGYSESEIESFINAEIFCTCSKCMGV